MSEGGLEPPRPLRALAPQASASAIPPLGPAEERVYGRPSPLFRGVHIHRLAPSGKITQFQPGCIDSACRPRANISNGSSYR